MIKRLCELNRQLWLSFQSARRTTCRRNEFTRMVTTSNLTFGLWVVCYMRWAHCTCHR